MKYTGEAQDLTVEDSGDAPPGWNYELIQHYVRDVTGNELAVYNDTTVVFWNVYGIENAGLLFKKHLLFTFLFLFSDNLNPKG